MKSIKTYGKNIIRNPFTIICKGEFVHGSANLLMNNDYIILCLPTANAKLPVRSPTSGGRGYTKRAHYTYAKLRKTINLVQMRKVIETLCTSKCYAIVVPIRGIDYMII